MQPLTKFKKILYIRLRATLNFRNFKVALRPMYRFCFSNFIKTCILASLSKFDIKEKIHRAVFKIKALKTEINCCYGYLLFHENDTNVFTGDWAFF